MSEGYVYIMSNPAMPGILKIGKTTRDPSGRANELFQTGVPLPFAVEYSVLSPDCDDLEVAMHCRFRDIRVAENREFFRGDLNEIMFEMDSFLVDQVRNFVERYLPCHDVVNPDYSVSEGEVNELAADLGADGFMTATAIKELKGDELRPALNRVEERIQRIKEERQKEAALTVVGNA